MTVYVRKVPYSQLEALLVGIGGDPGETSSVLITPAVVEVTTYCRNEQGKRYLDPLDRTKARTETVRIPIDRKS